MDVTVEMHDGPSRQYLREAARRGEMTFTPARDYKAITAHVREARTALFDVTGLDAKPLYLEILKSIWELGGARAWTEAQWAKNKEDIRRLGYAQAAIELKLEEVEVGREQKVEYDKDGRIVGSRSHKVMGQKLHVTGW